MYVDNIKVKRRLPKNIALEGHQAPGKIAGGWSSSFYEGEWKLSGTTWVENLEWKQNSLLLLSCGRGRAEQIVKRAIAFSSLTAGSSEGVTVSGNRLFSWHILSQRNQITFVVCMPVLAVIQQWFCIDFSWISIHSQYNLVDAALQQQDIPAIPSRYTGQPWTCEIPYLFLGFPIHNLGSGTHWFAKVLWDPQEKSTK